MEISECVYEIKHPTVRADRILTISGACVTEIVTSLSWLPFFKSKSNSTGIKYYRNLVKRSCEIMRGKFILVDKGAGSQGNSKFGFD